MRRLLLLVAAVTSFGAFASVTLGVTEGAPPITIDVTSPVEATDSSGADVTYHVRSHVDLVVTCTPSGSGVNFDVTAHFGIGTSSIDCSDTNGNTGSASVTVRDTTPPTVTVPSGASGSTTDPSGTATVSWPDATATDSVDGSLPASCNPSSGSAFPIGTTTVTCTATDAHGNTGSASFSVTVTFTDTTPPTISAASNVVAEATSRSGAAVSYSVPAAADNSGVPPTVGCTPPPGSTFALGETTVTCTATDAQGNAASTSFKVTVLDTTQPTLNLPGGIAVETEAPGGASVTYTASASDAVAGTFTPNCSPASGATFPVGTSQVTCTASDGRTSPVSGQFNVTVTLVDHTAPTLSGVSANRTVEANGPGGSAVNYTNPTASDNLDGPIAAVSCTPVSGSTFALGTTTVTCSATDAHGNTATASFLVSVVDTTKPSLTVPADRAVYAESPTGISAQSSAVASFLGQAQAVDSVDPHPSVSNDAPGFFGVGIHVVTFVASDASGNTVSKTATLDVRPQPEPGTTPPPLPVPPARTPPRDVTALKAEAGDAQVRLSWNIPAGIDHVVVTSALSAGGDAQVVYTGSAETFTVRNLVNGLDYRFVVVSVDKNGDTSAGVAVSALPKATLLRSPRDGAQLKKPPKLLWVKDAEASYYNVQLFRGSTKILSAWPTAASLTLKRTWKYNGRKYTLTSGVYRWYVWPGLGARANADYGELLGFSTFQIVR